MASFYLAARYSRREELCEYKAQLEEYNHKVTSRWLDGSHQLYQGKRIGEHVETAVETHDPQARALLAHFAHEDVEDVRAAEIFVAFTEVPRSNTSRGGRHVEMGLAIALDKEIVVVGPRENAFYFLGHVNQFDTWEAAYPHLRELG